MRTPVLTAACAVAVAAVALAPIVVTAPAVAAAVGVAPVSAAPHGAVASGSSPTPTVDFSAGVRSIDHGLGIVTLAGTAPVGTSIELGGDVVEPVWTEADASGAWSGQVVVRFGEHVVRVTSAVSGRVIDIPVDVRAFPPPSVVATVDGIARTIELDGIGVPGAHFVIRDDDRTVGETDVDADGAWRFTLRDLSFGEHHVEALQYFDGTHNGGVSDRYRISGAALLTESTASRETDRITLAGRAPAGTSLTFTDAHGPVLGAEGEPVRVPVGPDTRWRAEFPIPSDTRFVTIAVTTWDGPTEIGATDAHVTVPLAVTGAVEELPDGSVRLSGTGELDGTVSLETESGAPVTGPDGGAIVASVGPPAQPDGYTWSLTVARELLPEHVVVARQRVGGVEQGALRLVLPALPGTPSPGGPNPGTPGTTAPGIVTGTHPAALHSAAGRLVPGPGALAYTGAEPGRGLVGAAALALAGLTVLGASRGLRRRTAARR